MFDVLGRSVHATRRGRRGAPSTSSRGSCPSARRSPRSPARARAPVRAVAARSTNGSCKRVLPGCALPRSGTGVPSTSLRAVWIASTGTTSHPLALDCAGAQCADAAMGVPGEALHQMVRARQERTSVAGDQQSPHPVVPIAANRRGRCEGIPARPCAVTACASTLVLPRYLPKASSSPALSRHSHPRRCSQALHSDLNTRDVGLG